MALIVKIAGVDKSNAINWRDFAIEQNITKEPDLCTFSVRYLAGGYKPSVGDNVAVELAGVKIFAGTIIELTDKLSGGVLDRVECTAKDYTFELDRKLVTTNYANTDADVAIKDILTQFTSGYTAVNVLTGAGKIKKLTFNYESPSKAIQRIADLFDWDWYVDVDKDVHFFSKEELTAPFTLNEYEPENFIAESLNVKEDLSQIKNSIYVRGGTQTYSLTSAQAEVYTADGKQNTFKLGHKFTNDTSFTVERSTNGGSSWTGQIEGDYGTDDPANFDVLYDPNKLAIFFREDNKPVANELVRIFGSYELPVIVYRNDQASIAKYGEFQFRIVNNDISSKEEASQKAVAELRKYAEKAHTGGFKTQRGGLKTGQWITLNLPSLGISGNHKIQKIKIGVVNPSTPTLSYDVSIVASEIVGSVDVLGRLLIGDTNQNVMIDQNEIVDTIYGYMEAMALTEVWEATVNPKAIPDFDELVAIAETWRTNPWGQDVEPIWVAGYYYPTGSSDQKRMAFVLARPIEFFSIGDGDVLAYDGINYLTVA